MSKEEKRWIALLVVAIIAIILWLILSKSPALQQVLQNAANALSPTPASAGSTYNVNMTPYEPADMPATSNSKCDSNSPCVFCSIPNAAYPGTPAKVVSAPTYKTVQAIAPGPQAVTTFNPTYSRLSATF